MMILSRDNQAGPVGAAKDTLCLPIAAETDAMPQPTMSAILDFYPVPALVISPDNLIQRASIGLLKAWTRSRQEFVGRDLFHALYHGSPTERFDRIPLVFAIETAIASRALRLCHAAYVADGHSWTARIIPIFNGDELLCLVLEWERSNLHLTIANDGLIQSWLPIDDAFRILVDAVTDYAIFLLDTRGNIMTWNPGAELNKGYTKDEIVGKHFSVFYGEDDLTSGKPERELEICLREGRVEDEGWRYRKDGTRFWANVLITAVWKDGMHVGYGKLTRNLTERKEAEMQLISAYEESTKLKNDFLANISHEIRTPMHGMLSACGLLLDGPLNKEQRETANIIEESGQVLLQVINDILDYSKLASDSFSINDESFDVGRVVNSIVRSAQTTLLPGVCLKLHIAPELPKVVEGDPLRFRQILQNIVGNAGKFTEDGSIAVVVSLLDEDDTTHTILTEVTDTGHGVSEESAQRLFKPFTQLDTTYQKRRQGTGLGLSIAKSLAELMGGQIGYRPNPTQQGSVFWSTVRFKKAGTVAPNAKPTQIRRAQRHQHQTQQCGRRWARATRPTLLSGISDIVTNPADLPRLEEVAFNARILAAEDNVINQKVLVGMLNVLGFKDITIVSDGSQALAALLATKTNASGTNPITMPPRTGRVSPPAIPTQPYDLVLMDISMPVMNGYEATARIRSAGFVMPIIAMTAYALKGDMEMCLEKGMDDYIAKPMNRQILLKKLLRWLTGNEGEAAAISALIDDDEAQTRTRLDSDKSQELPSPSYILESMRADTVIQKVNTNSMEIPIRVLAQERPVI